MTTTPTRSEICSPSFATPRRPDRPNRLSRVDRVAKLLGFDLMPWQRQVVAVATEYDPATGFPFYPEVFVTTPRQSGKSSLIFALLLDRCLAWGSPQACVWTGQDRGSIALKWRTELVPLLERSELAPMVASVRYANGSEAVEFRTGSRVSLLASSESSGHGMVLDFCVLDEIFSDSDDRREAALAPTMITRPDAQMMLCSTAGDATAHFYNRKVTVGRKAVADDLGEGVAYFEWSAPDDWDPEDEASWSSFMPALGHTITAAKIRQRLQSESRDEFVRAYGNRPRLDESDVIPPRVWDRVQAPTVVLGAPVRFSVEINQDRSVAAIAATDGAAVELVDARQGSLDWVVPTLEGLAQRFGVPIVADGTGPVAALADIESVPGLVLLKSAEVARACGAFYDAVADGAVLVRSQARLDAGVKGLVRRPVGDRFVWSRKGSRRDVTGLFAVTLAWGAETAAAAPQRSGFAFVVGGR
jgi:hypothetical protein